MITLSPYLVFKGRCREAMTFYRDCFGGVLILQTVKESPLAHQWPESAYQDIMHAGLVRDSLTLLASDMGAAGAPASASGIVLALGCSTDKEIGTCFAKLSEDGWVTHPLHRFPDGMIRSLIGKYGMSWVLKRLCSNAHS